MKFIALLLKDLEILKDKTLKDPGFKRYLINKIIIANKYNRI